jgi:molecular chaperone DnaK
LASAGQAGPEAGAAGAQGGASSQDDVVDAEFTEVRDDDKKS